MQRKMRQNSVAITARLSSQPAHAGTKRGINTEDTIELERGGRGTAAQPGQCSADTLCASVRPADPLGRRWRRNFGRHTQTFARRHKGPGDHASLHHHRFILESSWVITKNKNNLFLASSCDVLFRVSERDQLLARQTKALTCHSQPGGLSAAPSPHCGVCNHECRSEHGRRDRCSSLLHPLPHSHNGKSHISLMPACKQRRPRAPLDHSGGSLCSSCQRAGSAWPCACCGAVRSRMAVWTTQGAPALHALPGRGRSCVAETLGLERGSACACVCAV